MFATTAALLGLACFVDAKAPAFPLWAQQFNKTYSSASERDYRNSVYIDNVRKIRAHSKGGFNWTMDVNQFADLTASEFATKYIRGGGYKGRNTTARHVDYSLLGATALPASVDWTAKGAVTPVKDQGQCGSCWAFSTTGAVEGAWFLKNGTLVSVSEQQLVDCSTAQGNQGCDGGLMDYGFQYIVDNKGITGEVNYPYTATGPNTCVAKGKPVVARVTGFKDVPTGSETALMTAVVAAPVSVAVEADQNVFQFYSGGVMTASCGSQLDHGVLAVGYGTLGGVDYYKVKNSWGSSWGDKGYILLGRGSAFGSNGQCGIQMDPSYPVV
uniref:Peptidase C1A papain C-terminal domain-containing protein n=1 Tax=viral metagenome TaxID=1070528 RepID=A0A6C0DSH2_9ZZZZ